jgi:hypothetical protein
MTTVGWEPAFKAKLRLIAKEKNCDPADLWQTLMIERFLVRLARSEYRQHFILKGATLLSRYVDLGRGTMDIDFLACKVRNETSNVLTIFQNVARIELNDGFAFKEIEAKALIHPHMNYSGTQVAMMAFFGRTRCKVFVDIGFGDVVEPTIQNLPLISYSGGPLFENSVEMLCYPKEFILAEKIETIIHRGGENSRMKDFHDVCSLINHFGKHVPFEVETTIRQVFQHRGTTLSFPVVYANDDLIRLRAFWVGYAKGLPEGKRRRLPEKFDDVIRCINEWIQNSTLHLKT